MKAQSLACRASSSRAARSSAARGARVAGGGGHGAQLGAARGDRHLADRGASPRSTGPCRCPRSTAPARPRCGSTRSIPSLTVTSSSPWRGASSSTAASQAGPSYHQWPSSSVSSAQQSSPPSATRARGALHEVARVLAGERQRGLAVVGAAGVVPGLEVVDGAAVVVAVGAVRRGSRRGRSRPARPSASRSARPPGPPRWPPAAGGRSRRTRGLVDAEGPHAVVGEVALQARRVGALRQPEAAAPLAEAAQVRGGAGGQLQPQPGVGGEHRQQRVGRARGPQLHPVERGERAEQVAAAALEGLLGELVVARRAAHLGGQRRARPPRSSPAASSAWIGGADLAQEAQVALARRRRASPRAGRTAPASGRPSPARRRAARAAAGRRTPPPPRATPRRTARCRSPRRRACASGAPAPALPGRGLTAAPRRSPARGRAGRGAARSRAPRWPG